MEAIVAFVTISSLLPLLQCSCAIDYFASGAHGITGLQLRHPLLELGLPQTSGGDGAELGASWMRPDPFLP